MHKYRPEVDEKTEILDDLIRKNILLSRAERKKMAATLRAIADGLERCEHSDSVMAVAALSAVNFTAAELLTMMSIQSDNKVAC